MKPSELIEVAAAASKIMNAPWPTIYTDDTRREFHCEHGEFVGHPGGADLMCGWCENGIPADEWSVMMREAQLCDALNALINATVISAMDSA
tara:strand:- start:3885 stop:4160 length:276 start_codon:yes stop_codon:yes gene_type:complete